MSNPAWRISDCPIHESRIMLKERLNVQAAFFDDCVAQAIFLAEGCSDHPAYRAKHAPRTECDLCWRLWLFRAPEAEKDAIRVKLKAWPGYRLRQKRHKRPKG